MTMPSLVGAGRITDPDRPAARPVAGSVLVARAHWQELSELPGTGCFNLKLVALLPARREKVTRTGPPVTAARMRDSNHDARLGYASDSDYESR